MINQFLSELDGVDTTNEGVLILAATNAPWHLDSAFRRPGRFDRILFVPPPDLPARASILAAANPVNSKYDPKLSVVDNIRLPPTLLSRFDLIYLVLDR